MNLHCLYFQSVKWSFAGWLGETSAEVMRSLKLTTGPDLPVRPIGPDGPLMASCGHKPKNRNHQSRLANIYSLYPEEVELCVHLSRTDLSAHPNLQHLSGSASCGSWTLLVFLTRVSAWVKAACAAPFHSCFSANKAGANPLSTIWPIAPPLPNKQSTAPHLPH